MLTELIEPGRVDVLAAEAIYGRGYWITEDVISQHECGALASRLSHRSQARGRAGARNLMSDQAVAKLASDTRLSQIARLALGESVVPYRATLFDKSGRANWLVSWHQDTALPIESPFESEEWGPWSAKAGIHYARAELGIKTCYRIAGTPGPVYVQQRIVTSDFWLAPRGSA